MGERGRRKGEEGKKGVCLWRVHRPTQKRNDREPFWNVQIISGLKEFVGMYPWKWLHFENYYNRHGPYLRKRRIGGYLFVKVRSFAFWCLVFRNLLPSFERHEFLSFCYSLIRRRFLFLMRVRVCVCGGGGWFCCRSILFNFSVKIIDLFHESRNPHPPLFLMRGIIVDCVCMMEEGIFTRFEILSCVLWGVCGRHQWRNCKSFSFEDTGAKRAGGHSNPPQLCGKKW